MSKSLVWVLNRLSEVGGGEKLLLEGVKYYRSIGYRVYIITWEFKDKSLFGGKYENVDIIDLNENIKSREKIFVRAYERFKSIFRLRKILKEIDPEYIFCQGEYDVAIVYLARVFTKLKYVFLIFGQIYQYPHDFSKYALIFRKHLKEIRNSQLGYRETIPLKMPKTSWANKVANELISLIRYKAVRAATSRFAFSKNVKWETKLLFGMDAHIQKGAFNETIFEEKYDRSKVLKDFNLPVDKKIILSFSRLDPKKRIDTVIKAFAKLEGSFILVIAGTGSDKERLQKLVEDLQLANRVYFLGYVQEDDANALKSSCDLFVSMDIGDFDISPFEALALGKKAIMPEEMDSDDNLIKFSNFNIVEAKEQELSEKMLEVDQRAAADHQQYMQFYTWENYFSEILKITKASDNRG